MNIVLWIFQALLAFFSISGGSWKIFKQDQLPANITFFSSLAWTVIGAVEVLGAVGLLIPALSAWAASLLALDGLFLALVYGYYSRAFVATNPLVWALMQVVLAALVAYGRFSLKPLS